MHRIKYRIHACTSVEAPKTLQRALGVDYGFRRIGLAVSTLGLAPRPLSIIHRSRNVPDLDYAKNVVDTCALEACDGIVVGLPVTQTGSLFKPSTDSQQGRRCRNFATALATIAADHRLPVYVVNEALSTSLAESYMLEASGSSKRTFHGRKDSVAASLILSSYFEHPEGAVYVKPWRGSKFYKRNPL